MDYNKDIDKSLIYPVYTASLGEKSFDRFIKERSLSGLQSLACKNYPVEGVNLLEDAVSSYAACSNWKPCVGFMDV